jgi:Domain of unknown function (DUF4124)
MSLTEVITRRKAAGRRPTLALGAVVVGAWLAGVASVASAQVYRWVDEDGVIHLSSEKPPKGVKAERIDLQGTSRRTGSSTPARPSSVTAAGSAPRASPAQVAEREDLLGRLRTRECVVALEALDRKTSGTEPTDASEIRRLKQTADLNCSQDPGLRSQQEAMAAKLRVANSPACLQARNQLADLLEAGSNAPREQVRSQQAFVDEHCTSPVR